MGYQVTGIEQKLQPEATVLSMLQRESILCKLDFLLGIMAET